MSRPIQCVGMKVDAYVLNQYVVADTYFLVPSSKPEYGRLLPGRFNLRHDCIPCADLDNAYPWQQNSRIADVETGELLQSRLGVYLHWCVPKTLRSGQADAGGPQQVADGSTTERQGSGVVEYQSVPDRWLIFRYVAEVQPLTTPAPALEIFLVESNKIQKLEDVLSSGDDLETSTSPFLDPNHPAEEQLRTVLGRVSSLPDNWNPGLGGLEDEKAAAQEGYHCPLTVLGTGDPLFADYMPHNAGVFTIHDDLTWGGQAPGTTQSATVSYVVYGFSAKDARGLLPVSPATQPVPGQPSSATVQPIATAVRLTSTAVASATSQPTTTASQIPSTTPQTTSTDQTAPVQVCWGSLYSVEYQSSASPTLVNATQMAQNFASKTPLAIGEDVVDACTAMLGGSSNQQESSMANVLRGLTAAAALQESNSQLERASIATTNFKSAHGGYLWRLAKDQSEKTKPSQPIAPTGQSSLMKPEQIAALRQLNQVQTYLNALFRRKRYVRHLTFCEWWKHRSLYDDDDPQSKERRRRAVAMAKTLLRRMEMVNSLISDAETLLNKIESSQKAYGPFVRVAAPKYYSHTDPGFVLRDMGSGWPDGWDADPSVIDDQTLDSWLSKNASSLKQWLDSSPFSKVAAPTTDARMPDVWDQYFSTKGLSNLPVEMQACLKNIVMAFSRDLVAGAAPTNPLITNPAWAAWDGQPWLPVFVEWEAEYVHIPREMWQLVHSDDGTVRYELRRDKALSDYKLSPRTMSGRSILLPNAQKFIVGLAEMMYGSVAGTGSKQNSDQDWMKQFLNNLSLLFGRLDGFTDHLLTLYQGSHVVPPKTLVKVDSTEDPIIKARIANYQAGEEIFIDQDSLNLLYGSLRGGSNDATETAGGLDVTPYGIDHEGLSYATLQDRNQPDENDLFFRPVTHGQARLTQFKIVDRFGQVICTTDPRPDKPSTPFYPYIGDGLLCESIPGPSSGTEQANTVIPLTPAETKGGDCSWFQLGPRINQDARLHADFMISGQQEGHYRPAAEGERAIFAWLLINYHDRSLQVYDADCSFRGEAFLPSGPKEPVYWSTLLGKGKGPDILPHMPPDEYNTLLEEQLRYMAKGDPAKGKSSAGAQIMTIEDLILSMSNATFLAGLWKTIVSAQDYMQAPPSQQYARFSSALVGRPLALAHLGLGMELATAPMHSQAYADYAEDSPMEEVEVEVDISECTGNEELTHYEFAVKIGDMLGVQDGLVAYFTGPKNGNTNNGAWTINTDYTDRGTKGNSSSSPPSRIVQHMANVPPLTVSPGYPVLLPPSEAELRTLDIADEAARYELRSAESLYPSITTVLVDPFLPVHIRSAILPIKKAKLDRAVVEHDLAQLGVWLQTGPVLIGARGTDPVADEQGTARVQVVHGAAAPRVPVFTAAPCAGGSEWKWVQPVVDEKGVVDYLRLGVIAPLKQGDRDRDE
ncbi:hypothetical protein CEP51_005302 [Fusarium floridanum]|uniref:Uncharacterized protein n=1 Tax=Fusarium floridanum TaxID=1325733 RepID=A0A428RXE2_9HYPO|nr:hypothetical protein CEP51_005302 [Fusarium floridanum]